MSLAQTQTVLRGERVPLDDGATKILHSIFNPVMLGADGCDVEIAPADFCLEYGTPGGRHYYMADVAPAIVSWFLDNAPAGYLPGGTLPNWGGMRGHWSYGPRSVWIDATDDCVMIMVRAASERRALDDRPLPAPPRLKPPIELLAGTHPCPHCGVVPENYRKLRSGGLVCLACGASS